MKLQYASLVVGLVACGVAGLIPTARSAEPGQPAAPAISEDANTALQKMGKTLSSNEFSFKARTIRVYQDENSQPLHIFHAMKVVARRPDRLAVCVMGDDLSTDLLDDDTTATLVGAV